LLFSCERWNSNPSTAIPPNRLSADP
jgi:hypothetical protein